MLKYESICLSLLLSHKSTPESTPEVHLYRLVDVGKPWELHTLCFNLQIAAHLVSNTYII